MAHIQTAEWLQVLARLPVHHTAIGDSRRVWAPLAAVPAHFAHSLKEEARRTSPSVDYDLDPVDAIVAHAAGGPVRPRRLPFAASVGRSAAQLVLSGLRKVRSELPALPGVRVRPWLDLSVRP